MPSLPLARYIAQLRSLPFVDEVAVRVGSGLAPVFDYLYDKDEWLCLNFVDGKSSDFRVDLHTSNLSAGAARLLADRSDETGQHLLLVLAPYVGATLGAVLSTAGVQFMDAAGNCNIRVGDRFVARVQAHTPTRQPAETQMRGAGYRVLYTLLNNPGLVTKSFRVVASEAGTSKQPVADLFARLTAEGHINRHGRVRRWARQDDSYPLGMPSPLLLERWVDGYRSNIRSKLLVGRFKLPEQGVSELEEHIDSEMPGVCFGGTAGAHRLVGHYRGPLTIVHFDDVDEDSTRRRLRALPSPSGEFVWMRRLNASQSEGWPNQSANPLLVYAELRCDDDPRAHEVAELVREQYLPWSNAASRGAL